MDTALMNHELTAAYHKALDGFKGFAGSGRVSAPHLLQVPEVYGTAKIRLMVVGKQTDGWGEGYDPSDVSALMRGYADFNLGGKWRRTPFWQAAHQLYRKLNHDSPPDGFLWSNLVKVDAANACPPPSILDRVLAWGLVPTEIQITQPEVMVFFTGNDYDPLLQKTFPDAHLDMMDNFVARVASNNLPSRTFRTPHPRWLRQKKHWDVISRVAEYALK